MTEKDKMLIKGSCYENDDYGYTAVIKDITPKWVNIEITGFDNCVKARRTPRNLKMINNVPVITSTWQVDEFNESFTEINKKEHEESLTDKLCHIDDSSYYPYVTAYILKWKNLEKFEPIMYKTKLVLSNIGLYDNERQDYPENEEIAFTKEELKNLYLNVAHNRLGKINDQIETLNNAKLNIYDHIKEFKDSLNDMDNLENSSDLDNIELE